MCVAMMLVIAGWVRARCMPAGCGSGLHVRSCAGQHCTGVVRVRVRDRALNRGDARTCRGHSGCANGGRFRGAGDCSSCPPPAHDVCRELTHWQRLQ